MKLASAALSILLASLSTIAYAQDFFCAGGRRPACLDYGDSIVGTNTACFDKFACDAMGFTCKSNLDQAVREHDALVDKYNDLLRKHKQLIDDYNNLVVERKR